MPMKNGFKNTVEEHKSSSVDSDNGPILCAKNCRLNGSRSTLNLCSKCYTDHILRLQFKRAQQLWKRSPNPGVLLEDKVMVTATKDKSFTSSSNLQSSLIPSAPEIKVAKDVPSRCGACKKRVGLTGFKCKCGKLLCGSHRYPEMHGCSYDYKAVGREMIARENPVVKRPKLDRI